MKKAMFVLCLSLTNLYASYTSSTHLPEPFMSIASTQDFLLNAKTIFLANALTRIQNRKDLPLKNKLSILSICLADNKITQEDLEKMRLRSTG